MDTKPDYVTEPKVASDETVVQPVLDRIKQALVTSRLTLAGQNIGADPYDSHHDRRRGSVWGHRSR